MRMSANEAFLLSWAVEMAKHQIAQSSNSKGTALAIMEVYHKLSDELAELEADDRRYGKLGEKQLESEQRIFRYLYHGNPRKLKLLQLYEHLRGVYDLEAERLNKFEAWLEENKGLAIASMADALHTRFQKPFSTQKTKRLLKEYFQIISRE